MTEWHSRLDSSAYNLRNRSLKRKWSESDVTQKSSIKSLCQPITNVGPSAIQNVGYSDLVLSLSCRWCRNEFCVSSCKSPIQLKPCNHLVCFKCLKQAINEFLSSKLPISSFACKYNCGCKTITHFWRNKLIENILEQMPTAGVYKVYKVYNSRMDSTVFV